MAGKYTLAVRCCCNPNAIFGWLPATEEQLKNRVARFPTLGGNDILLNVERYTRKTTDAVVNNELAWYSDDHTVEFFRKIPGFIENTIGV